MIIDFLKTDTPVPDLATALKVLREFKGCESQGEWLMIPFAAWTKLEQLQEFLEHLVEGEPLQADTVEVLTNPWKSRGALPLP